MANQLRDDGAGRVVADRGGACRAGLPERLASMVHSAPWLVDALQAARDVDPPDWLIGGGVLRDLVWDRLHGRPPARPRDLDLAFFDPARLDPARDAEVEAALTARLSGVPWDAKNQAAVHTWYGRVFGGQVAPLTSAADGVATWPETATAVAVRLLPDDRLQVVAPCGLEDLFGLICRRNPRRVTIAHYRQRIHDKRITERWPRVEVVL
jgi:uncharacterized protein